jgi:hypothetical protein
MDMGVPRVCCLLMQEIEDARLTRLGQVTMAVNIRNGHVMRRVIENGFGFKTKYSKV